MTLFRDEEAVKQAVLRYYEAGQTKDFQVLARIKFQEAYTKFNDAPPYLRQSSEEASLHEELSFASLADFQFQLQDLRIDLLGDVAIATFYLQAEAMMVDDYTFRGEKVSRRSRVSMVFKKVESDWLLVHHHASTLPQTPSG